jgi:autotransporter-associated beta strand protein
VATGTELVPFGGTPSLELANGVTIASERLQIDDTADQVVGLGAAEAWDGPIVISTDNGGFDGPCTGFPAPAAGDQANFGVEPASGVLALGGPISEDTGSEFNGFSVNARGGQDGTVVLSGTNTYTGPVTVFAGALSLRSNTALGGPGAEGVFLEGSSMLQFQGGIHIDATRIGGINVPAIQVDGTGGITRIENVSGPNTFDGDICLDDGSTIVAVDNAGDTLTLHGVISEAIPGSSQSLVKDGPGTLVLGTTAADPSDPANSNTFSGGLTVDAGILEAVKTGALGTGMVSVLDAAALQTAGGSSVAQTISLNNGIDLNTTAAVPLENLSGFSRLVTSTGVVQLHGDTTIAVDAGTLFIGEFGGGGSGILVIPGSSANLTKTGPGTLELDAASSYGNTTVIAGTLANGVNNALPTATALTVAFPGVYDLNGFNQQVGSIAGGLLGTITDSKAAATLTVNNTSADEVDGTLSGSLALTKTGGGTLTLRGTNPYTGATLVQAGTLDVEGSQPGSPVEVRSNATLTGTGTVGSTTVDSGGTLFPRPGGHHNLTVQGSLTLQSGSVFHAQLNGSNAMNHEYSQVDVTGSVAINAGVLDFSLGFIPSSQGSMDTAFTLISGGPVNGTFSNRPDSIVFGQQGICFQLVYNQGSPNVVLTDLSDNHLFTLGVFRDLARLPLLTHDQLATVQGLLGMNPPDIVRAIWNTPANLDEVAMMLSY